MRNTSFLALAAAVALGACDGARAPLAPAEPAGMAATGAVSAQLTAAPTSAGDRVARALALALSEPAVRVQLRNAMRQSRFHEHKLVLQEYAATREGERLVAAAARHAGTDAATVRGWIAALPALDFYLPIRTHRQAWRGGDNVVVGFTANQDQPGLTGYRTDGAALRLDRRGATASQVVVILHPAEPKSARQDGEAPADAIEVMSLGDPPGDFCTVNDPDCCTPENPSGCTEPGGGGTGGGENEGYVDPAVDYSTNPDPWTGSTTTYSMVNLRAYTFKFDDGLECGPFGDCWGENEIMIKHYADVYGQQRVTQWINSNGGYSNDTVVVNVNLRRGVFVKVWERDSGTEWGNDDYIGGGPMLASGQQTHVFHSCRPTATTTCGANYIPGLSFENPIGSLVYYY